MTIGSRAKACKRQIAHSAHGVEKVAPAKRRGPVSPSDGAGSVECKEEIAFRASTSLSGSCRKPLKKQRADNHLGAWRRRRGNPLYLAVLIGGVTLIFFAIVVSPLCQQTPFFPSWQYAKPRQQRVPVHRAVLRARRRVGMAAVVQHSNRRGAFSIGMTGHHHRQSSVVRHRKLCGHRQHNVCPVVRGPHQSSSAAAELLCSVGDRRNDGTQHRRCRARAHACAPSNLPSFITARAWRSLALAAASPT